MRERTIVNTERHMDRPLSPAEAACFTCPFPDCIWQYGRHRNYCPIQRERMEEAKRGR